MIYMVTHMLYMSKYLYNNFHCKFNMMYNLYKLNKMKDILNTMN